MDQVTAAYIAGIMDGEGCFRIERFRTDRSPIGFQYRTIAEVTMCERSTIEFIAAATGKKFGQRTLPSGRTAYTIVWRNGIAGELIRSILPYLHGKRDQAALCLHFEDEITPGRGRTYTPEHAVVCEALRNQVSALKKPDALRC